MRNMHFLRYELPDVYCWNLFVFCSMPKLYGHLCNLHYISYEMRNLYRWIPNYSDEYLCMCFECIQDKCDRRMCYLYCSMRNMLHTLNQLPYMFRWFPDNNKQHLRLSFWIFQIKRCWRMYNLYISLLYLHICNELPVLYCWNISFSSKMLSLHSSLR